MINLKAKDLKGPDVDDLVMAANEIKRRANLPRADWFICRNERLGRRLVDLWKQAKGNKK